MTSTTQPIDMMAAQLESLRELYQLIIESPEDAALEHWLESNLGSLVEQLLGIAAISLDAVQFTDAAASEPPPAALAAVHAALVQTCRSALSDLRGRCADGAVHDFAAFYRHWVECFEAHYEALLCEPAFGRDFGALVNLLLSDPAGR